jgi:hypothetical protein
VDLNDNGISAADEGDCCIDDVIHCFKITIDDICDAVTVKCDKLLFHDDNTWTVCGGSANCICYTIGDYEKDGLGPTDNCPTVDNHGQTDSDGDGWGDACDMCRDLPVDPRDDNCQLFCPDECLPYVDFPNADTAYLFEKCAFAPHDAFDEDQDNVGDDCGDNCLGVANFDQLNSDEDPWGDACDTCPLLTTEVQQPDTDGDGAGDACDECPGDVNKVAPGACGCGETEKDKDEDGTPDCHDACPDKPYEDADKDSDEDEIPDDCDNCPDIQNPNQEDADEDGTGDACAQIEYTGAFTCNYAPANQRKAPAFLIGKIIALL